MSLRDDRLPLVNRSARSVGNTFRDRDYCVVGTARSINPSSDEGVVEVPGDIVDRRTAERVVGEAVERFGHVDTLVNNAGIFIPNAFTEYSEADFAAMVGVNLAGFFPIAS